jgi:glycosyltransferase involved in cell wall biosynthesis
MPRTRFVLAPRGELHPGALSIRRPKKVGFLRLARALGLLRGVVWHATSEEEAESIREWFGARVDVIVAPVITGAVEEQPVRRSEKNAGSLEIAFLSRISPKKNLLGAIRLLDGLSGELSFNIFGPTEDRGYWEQCRAAARQLPPNVKVRYHGGVAAHEVADVLAKNHVLLFPTLGENFGHVISEALLAGVPVLVSDQTPWRGLEERRAGWDLPLARPDMFKDRIARLVGMDGREFEQWSHGARRCGIAYASDPRVVESNRLLFQRGPIS